MSSIASSNALDSVVKRAVVLYANTVFSPTDPDPYLDENSVDESVYTLKKALLEAGADESEASTLRLKRMLAECLKRQYGRVLFEDEEKDKKDRFENLLDIFEQVSTEFQGRAVPKTGLMLRRAGFFGKDLGAGANYQWCKRKRDDAINLGITKSKPRGKNKSTNRRNVLLGGGNLIDAHGHRDDLLVNRQNVTHPPSAIVMDREIHQGRSDEVLSPSSMITDQSPWPTARDDASMLTEPSKQFDDTSTVATARSQMEAAEKEKKKTRNTSIQAQENRKEIERKRSKKAIVFKFATAWYEAVKKHEIDMMTKPQQIADFFNHAFAFDNKNGICASLIERAYANGTCDQKLVTSPRNSRLDDGDYRLLCDAFWTMNALEQSNVSSERMTIADEKKLLELIVNAKIDDDNKDVPASLKKKYFNKEKLHNRIATSNSLKQDIKKVDERVLRRVQWCTYENQLKHYKASERELVDRGYARYPTSEEERAKHGFVVFHPGQQSRYLNIDEVRVNFDIGSEQAGGRTSLTHTSADVREGGKAAASSEDFCTLLMGFAGNEALPYLVILPSSSSDGNSRINAEMVLGYHQIHGKYGYQQKRWHDPTIATSSKGSMTKEIMANWLMKVQKLWPDLKDTDMKRIFLKLDTGPGRDSNDFLFTARALGVDIFPGLPNGTEVGQEMDQLFSAFKKDLYTNRDKLCLFRGCKISKFDMGLIIHGGVVTDPETERTLTLVNAFERNFTVEKIRAAREKCGYCPATRNALNDPKLRLVVDGEEIEETKVPQYEFILDAERINHESVDALVERGYKLATKLKRDAFSLQPNVGRDDEDITTEPNTQERIDLLKKQRYAGQWFRITNGGGVYNCRDLLFAKAEKGMAQEAKELRKQRDEIAKWDEVVKQSLVSEIRGAKDPKKYRVKDFKNMIKYMLGLLGPEESKKHPLPTKSEELEQKWKELKGISGKVRRKYDVWSENDQLRLERLERGEIDSVEETDLYGRSLATIREFLITRVRSLSQESWEFVMGGIIQNLSPDQEKFLAQKLDLSNYSTGSDDDQREMSSMEDDELLGFNRGDTEHHATTRTAEYAASSESSSSDSSILASITYGAIPHTDTARNELDAAHIPPCSDSSSDSSMLIPTKVANASKQEESTIRDKDDESTESECEAETKTGVIESIESEGEDESNKEVNESIESEGKGESNTGVSGSIESGGEYEEEASVDETQVREEDNGNQYGVEDMITKIEQSEDKDAKIALYKILIQSRGKRLGRRKKLEALQRYWESLKNDPLESSVEELREQLEGLVHRKSNKRAACHLE